MCYGCAICVYVLRTGTFFVWGPVIPAPPGLAPPYPWWRRTWCLNLPRTAAPSAPAPREVRAHLVEAEPPQSVGALPLARVPLRHAARHAHEEPPPAAQQLDALEPRGEPEEGSVAAASARPVSERLARFAPLAPAQA